MVLRRTYDGKLFPNSKLWKAIKYQDTEERWSSNGYFSTSDTLLRAHGLTHFTAGVVHLVRNDGIVFQSVNPENDSILDCSDDSGSPTKGYSIGQRAGEAAQPTRRNQFEAWGWGLQTLSEASASLGSAFDSSAAGRIQITGLVVSDDAYVPGGLFVNGKFYEQYPSPFAVGSNTASDLRLGYDNGSAADPATRPTKDYVVGWFFHEEAMSKEELFIWYQNILAARGLPDTLKIDSAKGVVPDYVFDVKSAMPIGTDAAPSTWTSGGATGGKTMSKTGAVDVIEVDAEMSAR